MAQKLIHKRSNQPLKAPTGATLDYGEIAVNYNVESPFLSIKNSDDTYSKFSSDDVITKYVSGELKLKSDTGHTHDDRYYTETEVDAKIKAVNDTIEDNELTTSAALNELNERVLDTAPVIHTHGTVTLTGDVEGSASFGNEGATITTTIAKNDIMNHMISVTYDELVTLRNNSQLISGQQYRITDYVTTTYQDDTRSAGHQFDVIVTTDNENTLNEVARVCLHEGDTYFSDADANLNSWQIWYSLDNDTEKFAWADAENGKGVIYRMIDEFGNDCPYDFKNIQFKRKLTNGILDTENGTDTWCYTFNAYNEDSSEIQDASVITQKEIIDDDTNRCYGNIINYYCAGVNNEGAILNNIVFLNFYSFNSGRYFRCRNNSFGNDCRNNSFGNGCYNNPFGNGCYNNSFGNGCYNNSFGNGCYNNSFGHYCHDNSFGNYYSGNSFGYGCNSNSFGNYCYSNTFGDYCHDNSFGNNCYGNTFGDYYEYNSFGNYCKSNSFGNYCKSNSFGNNCYANSFGNNCYANSFGNGCYNNSFRVRASGSLKDYVEYNHFDDGCSYNIIWNSDTTSSSILLKNININRGVCGTASSYNYINITTLNQDYEINVNQIDGIISIGEVLSIKYESLKTLRDNAQLVPGMQYRIIDYVTTTSQENTQSAGHPFDIIVTADSENTLNEEARAIQNIDDVYFDDSNLSAWKLWYCLDNDTDRFAWAGDVKVGEIEHKSYDSSECTINSELIDGYGFITPFNFESCVWVDGNGDGNIEYWGDGSNHDEAELVYEWDYFTDENGDTQLCLYKSRADLYEEEGQPDYGDKYLYRGVVTVDGEEYDYWQKWDEENESINIDYEGTIEHVYATTARIVSNPEAFSAIIETEDIYVHSKGVIYRMIDEFGNDCPYDFKNIQFARWELSNPVGYRYDNNNWIQESTPFDLLKTGFYGLDDSNNVFNYGNDSFGDYKYKVEYTISGSPTYCYTFGKDADYSISGSNYSNVIKEYYNSKKIQLNNIVFLGNNCYSNSFGNNCYSNSFGNYCYSNSFGIDCNSNSFGIDCEFNSFGIYCDSNSFGNYCQFNSFGNYCEFNSFGEECGSNTFGNNCNFNIFGDYCGSNIFGDYCNSNSFGVEGYYNSFGNYCEFNSFGNYFYYNSFGEACSSNSFGEECSYNSFGNYCDSNSFGFGCDSNSFGNECSYNSFGEECSYDSFGNYCNSNTFGESEDNPKSYYRYIIFDNGNSYINLNCTSTTSSSKYYQNVRIGLGVNNTDTFKTINDSNVGQTYETLYKPANSQTITI